MYCCNKVKGKLLTWLWWLARKRPGTKAINADRRLFGELFHPHGELKLAKNDQQVNKFIKEPMQAHVLNSKEKVHKGILRLAEKGG
jgi:hypothetical protein